MPKIPEFTETELWTIQSSVDERFGRHVELQLAAAELRLEPHDRTLTECPTAYWKAGDCHFVVCKTGAGKYRCQFFYSVREEYGTGVREYDDLADCIVSLLQAQADHQSKRKHLFPEENDQR